MRPFEFVLVIVSVIVGLALTEFAIGVADMIEIYDRAHFYWAHIAMIALGFISSLNYWGAVYKLRRVNAWSIPSFGILFLSGLVFFTITRVNFPEMEGFDGDYEKYFNEHVRIMFILTILFVVFFMLESFIIRKIRQPKKYSMGAAFILVISTGVIVENDDYQAFLTGIILVMQIIYMYATRIIIYDREDETNHNLRHISTE